MRASAKDLLSADLIVPLRFFIATALLFAVAGAFPVLANDSASDSERVWVTVEGFGENDEEARRNAWSTAVSQVVGTMVDSETVIENDQLIRDEVLEYSDGYIETFKILSRSEEEGVVIIRMEALVRVNMVRQRLRELATVEVAVDGSGLAAQIQTRHQRASDARAMLSRALEPFIEARYMTFRELQQQEILLTDRGAIVPYTVAIGIDRAAYREASTGLLNTLGALGVERLEVPLRVEDGGEIRVENAIRESIRTGRIEIQDNGIFLAVQRGMSAFVHALPQEYADSGFLARYFKYPALIVRLSLVDNQAVELIAVDQCLGDTWDTEPCNRAIDRGVRGIISRLETASDDPAEKAEEPRGLIITGLNALAEDSDTNIDRRSRDGFETIAFEVELTASMAEDVHRARVTLESFPALDARLRPKVKDTTPDPPARVSASDDTMPTATAESPGLSEPDMTEKPRRHEIPEINRNSEGGPHSRTASIQVEASRGRTPSSTGFSRFSFSLGGGPAWLVDDSITQDLDYWPGPFFSGSVQMNLSASFGIALDVGFSLINIDHNGEFHWTQPGIQLAYKFFPYSRFAPYLRAGISAAILDVSHPWPQYALFGVAPGFTLAAGLEFGITDKLALQVQQFFRGSFPIEIEPDAREDAHQLDSLSVSAGAVGVSFGLRFAF